MPTVVTQRETQLTKTAKKEQHTCEAVVAHCMDFRFQNAIHKFLQERWPDNFDRPVAAGGVRELVDKGEKSFVLEQLKLSCQLHEPKTVVLMQHEDCGAYGGSRVFENVERERAFQTEQLKKAEELVKHKLSGVRIEKYFACLSNEIVPV